MKKILSTLLVLTSLSSFAADKTVLSCTTPGDALSSVEIVQKTKTEFVIKIHDMDDSTSVFKVDGKFSNSIQQGQVLIAAKDFDNAFGGAVMDALMINISSDRKSAKMAQRGSVYFMTCQ